MPLKIWMKMQLLQPPKSKSLCKTRHTT